MARSVSRRMIEVGVIAGIAFGIVVATTRQWLVIPFTNDAAVRAQAEPILWFVAALQPVAAVVFVLDGILIGAGDSRYLAAAMVVASAVYGGLLIVLANTDPTLAGLWAAFTVWMLLRGYGLVRRFRTNAWAVTGTLRTS